MLGCCILIDRQHAARMETESCDLSTSFGRQVVTLVSLGPRLLRCVFFPRKLLKSTLDGRKYSPVAGSHNQTQLCRQPRGFKSARFLIGPLKLECWVQLTTEF